MLTIQEYEAKREARYNRLVAAANKAEQESQAKLDQSRQMSDCIPFGQPILVGHYSENRGRNFRERMHNKASKGFELAKKAEEYRSRAASVEANDAIYSDDPQAVEKIESKLDSLLALQAEYKRINAALRKGVPFSELEMSEENRHELLVIDRVQSYYQPLTKGFPPYMLSNLSAKIRSAKQRAEVVEKKQAISDKDEEINGVKIQWRPSENRIRLDYGQRVPLETYKLLKKHGFRTLRDGEGHFSAYYNNNAAYFIKIHIKKES